MTYPPFMTPAELAASLKVPPKTVSEWRYKGTGPKFYKIGKHVRYRLADVEAWLAAQRGA